MAGDTSGRTMAEEASAKVVMVTREWRIMMMMMMMMIATRLFRPLDNELERITRQG
jgi:hypothetical protein